MDINRIVSRFLSWPVPRSVCCDSCMTDANYEHPRYGTNILTATEAKDMLQYILAEDGYVSLEKDIRGDVENAVKQLHVLTVDDFVNHAVRHYIEYHLNDILDLKKRLGTEKQNEAS